MSFSPGAGCTAFPSLPMLGERWLRPSALPGPLATALRAHILRGVLTIHHALRPPAPPPPPNALT